MTKAEIKINLKPLHNDKNNEVKYMYNIVTLDKEKIEELKLEKREVLVYTFISLVSGSYTAKEMAAILGIGHDGTGFNYPLVKKYCDSLVEKGLIKRNEDKFIIIGGQND